MTAASRQRTRQLASAKRDCAEPGRRERTVAGRAEEPVPRGSAGRATGARAAPTCAAWAAVPLAALAGLVGAAACGGGQVLLSGVLSGPGRTVCVASGQEP